MAGIFGYQLFIEHRSCLVVTLAVLFFCSVKRESERRGHWNYVRVNAIFIAR